MCGRTSWRRSCRGTSAVEGAKSSLLWKAQKSAERFGSVLKQAQEAVPYENKATQNNVEVCLRATRATQFAAV